MPILVCSKIKLASFKQQLSHLKLFNTNKQTINGPIEIKTAQNNPLTIKILKHSEVVDKLIKNMINLLTELQEEYKDNIDIRR